MKFILAKENNIEEIYTLVNNTIRTVYPNYYSDEVVVFFLELHAKQRILDDISNDFVYILIDEDNVVGTATCIGNHITRVFVKTCYHGRGYGTFMMQYLEDKIAQKYETAYLDASLAAVCMYQNRGYKVTSHEKIEVCNNKYLVYCEMEKFINISDSEINYNGRQFVPKLNSENGEVNNKTVFSYFQKGNVFWADYRGGDILKGKMIGTVSNDGELDFYYIHLNNNILSRVGKCHSIPVLLENGKIELHEKWQWLDGDNSKGESTLVER